MLVIAFKVHEIARDEVSAFPPLLLSFLASSDFELSNHLETELKIQLNLPFNVQLVDKVCIFKCILSWFSMYNLQGKEARIASFPYCRNVFQRIYFRIFQYADYFPVCLAYVSSFVFREKTSFRI
ncbi:hypothetical protein M758_1G175900 [Ceratodon purpureus]|nr:hypothetical protein M758_1G175900 [Ceratodon purpureus]